LEIAFIVVHIYHLTLKVAKLQIYGIAILELELQLKPAVLAVMETTQSL
jgi:hypothetical protein